MKEDRKREKGWEEGREGEKERKTDSYELMNVSRWVGFSTDHCLRHNRD